MSKGVVNGIFDNCTLLFFIILFLLLFVDNGFLGRGAAAIVE